MSGDTKKLIAFPYFGGKFTWVDWLYKYFPEHIHFIDVFCGSLAVTLNKSQGKLETVNDINSEIINFFRVLRENPDELLHLLELTPVSRAELNEAWDTPPHLTPIERARRFYVRQRQSIYAMGAQQKNKGWELAKTMSRTNRSETVNKWRNGIQRLQPVINRLLNIQIECTDFRQLIPKLDFPGAFFYCDPPYPEEARNSRKDYRHDFTLGDHVDLATVLHLIDGKAMISSYDCPFMRSFYEDWHMVKFPVKHNNIRKGKVQECIWMNYSPDELGQLTIDLR